MNARQITVLVAAAAALFWLNGQQQAEPLVVPEPLPMPAPCPGPGPCPEPSPSPDPKPDKPKPPRKPWGELETASVDADAGPCKCCPQCKCPLKRCPCRIAGGHLRCSKCCECGAPDSIEAKVGGNVSPNGIEIQCDLPGEEHLKNKGGRDGAGLCVFTSIDHSARWQNVPALIGFCDWMTKHPGGGYPSKVTKMVEAICKERGVPVPDYLQVEGKDLEILRLACKTGRMPAVTYSYSPTGRYGGSKIAHMVSLPHADGELFCVLDNNYPGADKYEWMNEKEFQRAYYGGASGWAVILLTPPPPPVPKNK